MITFPRAYLQPLSLPSLLQPSRAIGVTAVLGLAGLLAACGSMGDAPMPMSANTVSFNATLSSAAEVPPKTSPGTGMLSADLDKTTNVLKWKMSYSGLTGPATMAHLHGPAMPGVNAGVVVPFPNAASPSEGSATLTPTQVADLVAGKWYVNVHTQANPGGEIRGQVIAK